MAAGDVKTGDTVIPTEKNGSSVETDKTKVEEKPVTTEKADKSDEPVVEESADDSKNGNDQSEAIPDDPVLNQKIKRQVEYYFGDYNLPKDKFLLEQIKKDDGWVPFTVMLNFKRLTSLTCDVRVIRNTLRCSDLLQISEDGSKLRRTPDKALPVLNEERRSELLTRTLYFKGFPTDVSLDTLLQFFQTIGGFENVQMRNWHDKVSDKWSFKGSVFVTFCDRDKAESVLKGEPTKYNEKELVRKWQADYIEEKRAERAEGKNKKGKHNDKNAGEQENGAEKGKNGHDVNKKSSDSKAPEHILGSVLHMKGFKENVKWSDIKDKLEDFDCGLVAFVDFSTGDVEGYARFKDADVAKNVFEKLEGGKVEIAGDNVEVRVLEGDEEVKYLDDQAEQRAKRSGMKRRGSFRGRGRGRGRGQSKRARRS